MESRARVTGQQFSTLLEFMESHGDLAKPQPGAQGRLRADTLWQELSVILNSIGGGVNKTPDKWKKVWADWKSKTKKKSLTIRRHASGTGGGPSSTLTLSTLETRVLAIIGELAVEGHPEIEEQGFNRPPDELIAPAEPHLPDINVGLEDGQPISLILAGPSQPVSIQPVSWQQEPPPPALTPLAANLPAPAAPPRSTSRQAEALSPLSSVTSPRRRRLGARRRRALTPFDRAASEFVAIEQHRLQLEEKRERNEAQRIEVDHERNRILNRFVDIAEVMLQQYMQKKNDN